MHQKADELRAEKGIKKAGQHAEQAEQDAAAAIELALYVLDQAEYAIVDAAIARADADDLAGTASRHQLRPPSRPTRMGANSAARAGTATGGGRKTAGGVTAARHRP